MSDSVVVAMSGGVDSSVAAALLVEQGYEVSGVMMRLWAEGENLCCSPEAVKDARRVAAQIGIRFHLVDYASAFKKLVVDPFISDYVQGRTPNPCLACNQHIRFGRLLQYTRSMGARQLATGHYARVDYAQGRFQLRMGMDGTKDQSYVLYRLGQSELAQMLFPIGSYAKTEIRRMAADRGLDVADKQDSMELCFVGDGDYRLFLKQHAPESVRPGPVLDTVGRVLGEHQGLPFYTVGQRRGLGIAASTALYVIQLDTARNALVVGPSNVLGRSSLYADQVHYVSGRTPAEPLRVQAKIRYRASLADATWYALDGHRAQVSFDAPLRDITPGQAVVAYQGDQVLGGGIISTGEPDA